MRRLLLTFAVGLPLAACGSSAALLTRPAGGYQALRVVQTFEMHGGIVGGYFQLPVGTTLVADRAMPSGELMYCGEPVFVSSFGIGPMRQFVCFARRGTSLTIHADRGGGDLMTNPVPPGAVEEVRM